MRKKEECNWCMSTQHIIRKISNFVPEEFKNRCSACHEKFWEEHNICDNCDKLFNNENAANTSLNCFCSHDCQTKYMKKQFFTHEY